MKFRSRLSSPLGSALFAIAVAVAIPNSAYAKEPPKRDVPDYDGRGGEPTTAGDVLLWIPRVILSPLYFISEYLIRRPLGAVLTLAEKSNLPDVLYDFFAFGPDHKAGFAPYAFIDFGFEPCVGVYLFWNDAGFKGHDLSLHASMWNTDWLAAGFADHIPIEKNTSLSFYASGIRRPDYAFFGIGPNATQANLSRYKADTLDGSAALSVGLWRSSRVTATAGARSVTFGPGYYGEDPTLDQQVASDVFSLPPGYASGYTLEYNQLLLAFDSRRPRPASGSGVRAELHGF